MPNIVAGYVSTKITQFFMTLVGMKRGSTKREQLIINAFLVYITATVFIAMFVQNSDLIYSRNDLYALTYNAPCSFTVTFDFIKLMIFTYKRRELHKLNEFADNVFWNKDYSGLDKEILDKCNTTSAIGMSILAVLAFSICFHYLIGPYLDALASNSTERTLPFRIVYDWPVTVTPYYEIMYTIDVVGTLSVCVCSVAFASHLYYTCIFISGQFKILQRQIEEICDAQLRKSITKLSCDNDNDTPAYETFKECVKQHQLLIWYIGQLEDLFCYVLLMLVLCIVIILCFSGFQVILGSESTNIHRQVLSVEFGVANTVQLVLFAFSCNEISGASAAIGEAAYRCRWYSLPYDENGRAVRQGLTLMVMRSREPCTLTVGKFCPMTLQVFTSVLSTALSYLTVLRGMHEDK